MPDHSQPHAHILMRDFGGVASGPVHADISTMMYMVEGLYVMAARMENDKLRLRQAVRSGLTHSETTGSMKDGHSKLFDDTEDQQFLSAELAKIYALIESIKGGLKDCDFVPQVYKEIGNAKFTLDLSEGERQCLMVLVHNEQSVADEMLSGAEKPRDIKVMEKYRRRLIRLSLRLSGN